MREIYRSIIVSLFDDEIHRHTPFLTAALNSTMVLYWLGIFLQNQSRTTRNARAGGEQPAPRPRAVRHLSLRDGARASRGPEGTGGDDNGAGAAGNQRGQHSPDRFGEGS